MKFAFDVHNTIDRHPEFFRIIMKSLENTGNEVWIISGPPKQQVINELRDYDIFHEVHYTEIVTIVDYLKEDQEVEMYQNSDTNSWWADTEEHWNETKAKICKNLEIDFIIDDKCEYEKYFNEDHCTKFIKF